MLQLFDRWYDELNSKLRNTYGSRHSLYDVALAHDRTNKLAITHKLFSSIRNKNTIEQEQLKTVNYDYDYDDVTTMSQACVQNKFQ